MRNLETWIETNEDDWAMVPNRLKASVRARGDAGPMRLWSHLLYWRWFLVWARVCLMPWKNQGCPHIMTNSMDRNFPTFTTNQKFSAPDQFLKWNLMCEALQRSKTSIRVQKKPRLMSACHCACQGSWWGIPTSCFIHQNPSSVRWCKMWRTQERGLSSPAYRCSTAGSISRETPQPQKLLSYHYLFAFPQFCVRDAFTTNNTFKLTTSPHDGPAALRRRQRQDEGRILWILLQKHEKSVSWLPK